MMSINNYLIASIILGAVAVNGDLRGPLEGHFVPYGVSEGDRLLNLKDDGVTKRLDLGFSYPFSNKIRRTLFVSNNGVISFWNAIRSYDPQVFPLCNGQEMIAVFWGDVAEMPNTEEDRNNGHYSGAGIFIRKVDFSNAGLLTHLTNDVIAEFPEEMGNFQAMSAFVVTWRQVRAVYETNHNENNTFQAVLITNGRHSFVKLSYGHLSWSKPEQSEDHAVIGFNARGCRRNRHYQMIDGSGTPQITEVAGRSFFFRTDSNEIQEGGCNTEGSIRLNPKFAPSLGGSLTTITGPCIRRTDDVVVRFNKVVGECEVRLLIEKSEDDSVYGVVCRVPLTLVLGRIPVTLSLDGGSSFLHKGRMNIVTNISNYDVHTDDVMNTVKPIGISWDPLLFAPYSSTVSVYLTYFNHKDKMYNPQHLILMRSIINTGDATLPWRLPDTALEDLVVPRAGVIAIRADSDSISPRAYSAMHILDWYRKSLMREAAMQSLTKGRQKRSAPNLDRRVEEIFISVDSEMEDMKEQLEGGVSGDSGEDEVQYIEDQLRTFEEQGEFDVILEVAFPSECDDYLDHIMDTNPLFLNPPPVPCLQGQARDDAGFRPNYIYSSVPSMTQTLHGEGVTECYISETFGSGSANQACYNDINHLVNDQPIDSRGGSMLFSHPDGAFTYNQQEDVLSIEQPYLVPYFMNDLIPLYECCVIGGECFEYYAQRPFDDCSNYPQDETAPLYGDPHITTLDGVSYTFNGLGEYSIIKTVDNSLIFQGRTQQAIDSTTGSPVMASNWQAFAMLSGDSDVIQVEASEVSNFTFYINGESEELEGNLTKIYFNGGRIERIHNITYVNFTRSRVSFRFENIENTLQALLIIPAIFREKISGLLGNNNGNPEDDFTDAEGNVLQSNATETQLHYEFGETYRTTEESSIFYYLDGESHADYQHPDFTPTFDVNLDAVPDAIKLMCDGDTDCLYDYYMTNNERVAEGTRNITVEHRNITKNLKIVQTCGFLKIPKNGYANNYGYLVDDEMEFYCSEGYHLYGSEKRTCQSDGKWSGEETYCSKGFVDPLVWSNIITCLLTIIVCCSIFAALYLCKRRLSKNFGFEGKSPPGIVDEKPDVITISKATVPVSYNNCDSSHM